MRELPDFGLDGVLPAADYEPSLDEIANTAIVLGPADGSSPNWDVRWRRQLLDNLSILAKSLSENHSRAAFGRQRAGCKEERRGVLERNPLRSDDAADGPLHGQTLWDHEVNARSAGGLSAAGCVAPTPWIDLLIHVVVTPCRTVEIPTVAAAMGSRIGSKQLWSVAVTEIFIDGSFVERKDHPNDIDGYFTCELMRLASGDLQRELNLRDPYKIWTWDPASRRAHRGYPKRQLPMWHQYRVELYPHVCGLPCGIKDKFGNELEFPAAFRQTRGDGHPKGIVKLRS